MSRVQAVVGVVIIGFKGTGSRFALSGVKKWYSIL